MFGIKNKYFGLNVTWSKYFPFTPEFWEFHFYINPIGFMLFLNFPFHCGRGVVFKFTDYFQLDFAWRGVVTTDGRKFYFRSKNYLH